MKRNILKVAVIFISFFFMSLNVEAASLNISSSSTTVTIGNKVTVKVGASGAIGKFSVSSSNSSVLAGGTGSVWLENSSESYEFVAKSLGSATITIKALDASDSDGNVFSSSKSITINVVKPREKSNNNNLKYLEVEGSKLTPAFSKDTLEYTATVESNVEKIKINASKEDGYASLEGTGEKEVQEGNNKFEIKVTSETGNSKVYTVNVIVNDSNPIVKKIDNKNYSLIKRKSSLEIPETFEETTVTINETEIPAAYNEKLDITLVGLKDEEGNKYLFKYDAKTDTYFKYISLNSKARTIIFEDSDKEINNFTKKNIKINNQEYNIYENNIDKNYVLLYGIELSTGNKGWYLYNIKEESIQEYMSGVIEKIENNNQTKIEEYKKGILIISGVSILLLLILIIEIVSKNSLRKKMVKHIQNLKEETEKIIIEEQEKNKKEAQKGEKKNKKKTT